MNEIQHQTSRKSPSRRRFAAAALFAAVALGVPLAAEAYILVCSGGYLVYQCNDGTQIACVTSDGGGNTYQVDCVAGSGGDHACEDHGGFVGVVPTDPAQVLACEYAGELPLEDLAGKEPPTTVCSAAWVGTCADGYTIACDDAKQSCPKKIDKLERRCDQRGGVKSSVIFVAFPSRKSDR